MIVAAAHTVRNVVCRCPVDDADDVYTVVVKIAGGDMIPVERILEAIAYATGEPAYQEDVTNQIGLVLEHAAVTLYGRHSGVETVTTYTPPTVAEALTLEQFIEHGAHLDSDGSTVLGPPPAG